MRTKSSIAFFQVPKIIHEDSKIKSDHIYLFMVIYDRISQVPFWNKTNDWLSLETKIGLRQLKHRLNDLEEWGYIERKGIGFNRKFSLGQKFNNRAEKELVKKSNRAEKEPEQGGKGTAERAEKELDNKTLFKIINKKVNFILKKLGEPQKQAIKDCIKFNIPLEDEHVSLQETADQLKSLLIDYPNYII